MAAAAFMAAAPLSTAIGSPISGALMELPPMGGLSNWQWLFIIEAVPAIVLGLLVLRVLKDSPAQASWLADDEKAWLSDTLAEENRQREAQPGHADGAWRALRDARLWVMALIYFGTSAGLYTLGLWAPLIIRQFGFSSLGVGGLNAIPSVLAVIAMVLWAMHSDRTKERTWHIVIPCLVACAGLAFAGVALNAWEVVLALVLVNVGISAAKAPLWAMPSSFLSGAGAAAGIAMINSVGNLGGFFGPFAIGWLKSRTGGYAAGLYVVAAMLAVSALLALAMGKRQSRNQAAAVAR
jgi:ACS family tartrate transporter-like MFS transporter